MTGITRPITKHNFLVKRRRGPRPDDPRGVPHRPHGPARAGRWWTSPWTPPSPSPSRQPQPRRWTCPATSPARPGHVRQIKTAAEAINAAERPVLYVGGGVIIAGAAEELRALADKGQHARDHHAAGPGRLRRDRPAVAAACSACTARPTPTTPSRSATA